MDPLMGCNYYFKNTGLDDCIIVVVVMIIITDCQDSKKVVVRCMRNSLSLILRYPRKDLFFILSGMWQKEHTNILNYKVQFSYFLFIGLFKQKI